MTQDQSSRSWRRWVPLGGGFILKPQLALLALLLLFVGADQASAELYTSAKSGNWFDSATWTNSAGGAGVPSGSDTVNIKGDNTVTVSNSATCANLVFSTGSSVGYVVFSGPAPALNVTTRLDVGNSTANTTHPGVLTFASDATVTAGQCYLNKQLKNGVTKSEINMAAGGRLVAGLLGTGGGAAEGNTIWNPGTGTVELNASNTLPATVWTNFNNLTLSAGTTTLAGNLAIRGKLEIGASAVMNLGTYANSTANTLWIGGVQQVAGVWGPVGSGAALTSARFTGSGRMLVANGGPPPPAAPTSLALNTTSVAENQPPGTAVGTFTATDPNIGDTHTFTLVSGAGDADNASFTIAGPALKTAAVFDFETRSAYSIRVRATDQGGLSLEQPFTVSVDNLNEGNIRTAVPPNIIIYMCDDMGVGEAHPYFGKRLGPNAAPLAATLVTPNLDRLAALGTLFTDVHAGSSVCSPT